MPGANSHHHLRATTSCPMPAPGRSKTPIPQHLHTHRHVQHPCSHWAARERQQHRCWGQAGVAKVPFPDPQRWGGRPCACNASIQSRRSSAPAGWRTRLSRASGWTQHVRARHGADTRGRRKGRLGMPWLLLLLVLLPLLCASSLNLVPQAFSCHYLLHTGIDCDTCRRGRGWEGGRGCSSMHCSIGLPPWLTLAVNSCWLALLIIWLRLMFTPPVLP